MEKMDSLRKCQHPRKAFAVIDKLSTMDPPMYEVPWICADCGEESVDIRTAPPETLSYASLKAKKARGGFGCGR